MKPSILTPEDLNIEERYSIQRTGYEYPPSPEELAAAKRRLTYLDEYTRHLDKQSKYRNDRDVGNWNQKNRELREGILAETYKHDTSKATNRLDLAYQKDKNTLKQYIGYHVIQQIPVIIRGRKQLLRDVARTYRDSKKLASLAQAIAVLLCYRAGLPLILTAEQQNFDLSARVEDAAMAYIEPSAAPKTYFELLDRFKKSRYWGTKNMPMWWHEWSPSSWDNDPFYSPFVERFKAVDSLHHFYSMAEIRKRIYAVHPICLVLDGYYNPYELADIIRISDVGTRNMKLLDIVVKLHDTVTKANAELEHEFTINWNAYGLMGEYKYNWYKYQPLLLLMSFPLHNGTDKEIEYLTRRHLVDEMMTSSPSGVFDAILSAAGLVATLGSFLPQGKMASALIWMGRVLTGIGVISAGHNVYKAFYEAPRSQGRERLIELLDKDLAVYENNTSKVAAVGLCFLELLFARAEYKSFMAHPPNPPVKPSMAALNDIDPASMPSSGVSKNTRMVKGHADDLNVGANNNSWDNMGSVDPLDTNVSAPKKPAPSSGGEAPAAPKNNIDVAENPDLAKKTATETTEITPTDRAVNDNGLEGNTTQPANTKPKANQTPAPDDAAAETIENTGKKANDKPDNAAIEDSPTQKENKAKADPDKNETDELRGTDADSKMNRETVAEKDGTADAESMSRNVEEAKTQENLGGTPNRSVNVESPTVVRQRIERLRQAQEEVSNGLDSLGDFDPASEMTNAQRYEIALEKNRKAKDALFNGIEIDNNHHIHCAEGLPPEVAELQEQGMVFYESSSGNLLYNEPGKGMAGARLVYPELRSAKQSGRAAAGLSNHSRDSVWYQDLRFMWEDKGLAKRIPASGNVPERWIMFDSEMNAWFPEHMIDMGHIKAAVEHNQDMLRFAKKARAGKLPNNVRLTEAEIEERIRRATRAFRDDHRNYLPQYNWRNQELGRRIKLRYGHLDESIPIGETGRIGRIFKEGETLPPETLAKEAKAKLYQQFEEQFNNMDIDDYVDAVTENAIGSPF